MCGVCGHVVGWLIFFAIVGALVTVDLGLLHRNDRPIGLRESLLLSAGYILAAALFGAGIGWWRGAASAIAFFTGYLVEKSLSLDNVFVIALVFGSLGIPARYQHRVLFWGIAGAMLMRGLMIALGAAAVSRFGWVMYVFAAVLLVTGVRIWTHAGAPSDPGRGRAVAFLRRHLRLTASIEGRRFVVRRPDPAGGRPVLWATPLLLALCLVEISDLLFALDSVPAIFAISTDPFVVYTSNIFAVIGLRALYFALAALVHRFAYLKFALGAILVFISARILLHGVGVHWPETVSLAVILLLIAAGMLASWIRILRNVSGPSKRSQVLTITAR